MSERHDLKWFGYKHVNGTVHLKRFYGDNFDDACKSDFVAKVYGPFYAPSWGDAQQKLTDLAFKDTHNTTEAQCPSLMNP